MEFKKEYILIFLILTTIAILKLYIKKKKEKNYIEIEKNVFTSTKYIMTKAEISFYHCIKKELTDEHAIFTKVRMEDIIQVKKGIKNEWSWRGKIKSRHIDFLICDANTGKIQRAIELNDSTHNRNKQKERDIFVKKAFDSAGIKLLTMTCKKEYSRKDIENLLF